jgi:hypothetical protein
MFYHQLSPKLSQISYLNMKIEYALEHCSFQYLIAKRPLNMAFLAETNQFSSFVIDLSECGKQKMIEKLFSTFKRKNFYVKELL